MKFMSYRCTLSELEERKSWLTNQGAVIFKVTMDDEDPRVINPPIRIIVFYAPTPDIELILKLKNPYGTFQDIMI